MVQLIAIGLIGGLGWYAYSAFKKQMARVGEELKKAESEKSKKSAPSNGVDELEKGPDGVYRLKNSDKREE